MTTQIIIITLVLWAALELTGIIAFAHMTRIVEDETAWNSTMFEALVTDIKKITEAQDAATDVLLGAETVINRHADSLLSMFELYSDIDAHLQRLEEMLPPPAGEIHLPDLSEEFEEKLREDWIENKDLVCRRLADLLRVTRAGEDIESIRYEKTDTSEGFVIDEYAVITWEGGRRQPVSITADSGKAIIQDVLKAI